MSNLISIVYALLGVSFLIAFHELGHFLFAKLFGVGTPSFSIGFGPRIFEKKIGDTTFALSAIPLGGYVEMAGNPEIGQGDQAEAHRTDKYAFNTKPYWQKMVIISGGVVFNLIFAYGALVWLFYNGAPGIGTLGEGQKPIIASIMPNTAAERAQLRAQDHIMAIDDEATTSIKQVADRLKNTTKPTLILKIERDGQLHTVPVDLVSEPSTAQKARLGVIWTTPAVPFGQALQEAFKATINLITQTAQALASIVTTRNTDQVGGPLMLIAQVSQGAAHGFKFFVFLLAFISINLAVFNVIPLPIVDGGQALFYTIEAITGRPLSDATRYRIHYYSWLTVIGLAILLTLKDIHKLTALGDYLKRGYDYVKSVVTK